MPIREATEADLPALMPLLRGYCVFYESNPSDDGLADMVRALLAAPEEEAFLLVATADAGEIVGFAACQWKWAALRGSRIVLLDDLFVAEAERGGGRADALIEACAAIARRHGAPAMIWFTQPQNHRAQAVYDRLGGEREPMLEYALEL